MLVFHLSYLKNLSEELTRKCRSGERDVSVIVQRKLLARMSFWTFHPSSTLYILIWLSCSESKGKKRTFKQTTHWERNLLIYPYIFYFLQESYLKSCNKKGTILRKLGHICTAFHTINHGRTINWQIPTQNMATIWWWESASPTIISFSPNQHLHWRNR